MDEKEAEAKNLANELGLRRAEVAKLSSELSSRGADAEKLRAEEARLRAALEKAHAHARLEGERSTQQMERAEHAERQLAAIRSDVAQTSETQAAEVLRYESALRESAQSIRALEAEIARRERMIEELVDGLEERVSAAPGVSPMLPETADRGDRGELQARLDALAVELARREGEAQASAWSLAELERKLAECLASKGEIEGGR